MKHNCGNEMIDMGKWPFGFSGTETTTIQVCYRHHCPICNEYETKMLDEYVVIDENTSKRPYHCTLVTV